MPVVGGGFSQPAVQQGVPHLVRASREEPCEGNCLFRRSNSLYPISPSQMLLGVEKVGNYFNYFNGIKARLPSYWHPICQVSRSSSLTTPTLKDSLPMDTLKLPDPRFFPHFFNLLRAHLAYTSPLWLLGHHPQETELCFWWLCSVLGLGLISLRLLVQRARGEEKQSLWPGEGSRSAQEGLCQKISFPSGTLLSQLPTSQCFCLSISFLNVLYWKSTTSILPFKPSVFPSAQNIPYLP